MTYHCNAAPELAAAQLVGIYVPFFACSCFGFSYLAESQSFHWYLISRDKPCIVTQCYASLQWLCKEMVV